MNDAAENLGSSYCYFHRPGRSGLNVVGQCHMRSWKRRATSECLRARATLEYRLY